MSYPNINQKNPYGNISYPNVSDYRAYQTNNYVPTPPTNYSKNISRNYGPSYSNQTYNYVPTAQTHYPKNISRNVDPSHSNQMNPAFQHGAQYNPQYGNEYDDTSLDTIARNGFIKKVYTLVTIQLLVTAGISTWAYFSPEFKKIFNNTPAIIILSITLMAVTCFISCATQTFRKYALPLFGAFTIIFSILVGVAVSHYKSMTVLTAVGVTFALVVALTLYAWFTKTDFSSFGPYLMVFCLALFIFGIIAMFTKSKIVKLVYSCLSAVLFSFYLIFDTQLILGRFENAFTLDDAYLAAIQLYADIIQIFLNILNIIGN